MIARFRLPNGVYRTALVDSVPRVGEAVGLYEGQDVDAQRRFYVVSLVEHVFVRNTRRSGPDYIDPECAIVLTEAPC